MKKLKYALNEKIVISILYILSFISLSLLIDLRVFNYIQNIEEIYKISISLISTIFAILVTLYVFKIQFLDNKTIDNSEEEQNIYDLEKQNIYNSFVSMGRVYGIAFAFNIICIMSKFNQSKLDFFILLIYVYLMVILIYKTLNLIKILIDPKLTQKVANQLIKEKINIFPQKDQISIGVFLEKYIEFEKIIDEEYGKISKDHYRIPFIEKIRKLMLNLNDCLNLESKYSEIKKLIHYRNYVVHGKIDKINEEQYKFLKEVLNDIERGLGMRYYTSKQLLKLREKGVLIEVVNNNPDDVLNKENLFIVLRKSEDGFAQNHILKKLVVEVIDREQCTKILRYLKENRNAAKEDLEREVSINFDINDSIYALIDKAYIERKDDVFNIIKLDTEYLN